MIQRIAKVHPHTGETLRPVFTSKTGRVFWPILGASEDDGNNDGDASGDNDEDADKDKDADADADADKSKSKEGADTDLAKEVASLTARMKAADKRAADAEKKAKEYEDKDKSALDKATETVTEHETTIKGLTETVQSLRLENAFALDTSVTWNDPALVLDIVRKDDTVTIDDDGKVVGMPEAIKRIAKDKPYLVKTDVDGALPKTGSRVGQGNTKGDKPDEARLRTRFRI